MTHRPAAHHRLGTRWSRLLIVVAATATLATTGCSKDVPARTASSTTTSTASARADAPAPTDDTTPTGGGTSGGTTDGPKQTATIGALDPGERPEIGIGVCIENTVSAPSSLGDGIASVERFLTALRDDPPADGDSRGSISLVVRPMTASSYEEPAMLSAYLIPIPAVPDRPAEGSSDDVAAVRLQERADAQAERTESAADLDRAIAVIADPVVAEPSKALDLVGCAAAVDERLDADDPEERYLVMIGRNVAGKDKQGVPAPGRAVGFMGGTQGIYVLSCDNRKTCDGVRNSLTFFHEVTGMDGEPTWLPAESAPRALDGLVDGSSS